MMWKEKYKIGVEHIDKQHEELFRRVSSLPRLSEVKKTGMPELIK